MSRIFNGTSDIITLATSPSLDTLGGNLAIMAWVLLTDSTVTHAIFGAGDGGTPILRVDQGLALEGLVMGATSGFTSSNTAAFGMPFMVWTHIAMTYDDAGSPRAVRLYINGVETSYATQDTVVGAEQYGTGFPSFLGTDIIDEFYQGNMAELRVYNIAPSPAQVAAIAADTTGDPNAGGIGASLVAYLHLCGSTSPEPDASGNGNAGVLTGTTQGPNSPGFACPAPPPPPPSGPQALIPLPFSKRLTAAVAVFDCIFIASPQGAQQFAFGNGLILGPLQSEYAQLNSVYGILRRQDVPSQKTVLYAAINKAVTIVASLNATTQAMTATGDAGIQLAGMKVMVANALATLQNVMFDEV